MKKTTKKKKIVIVVCILLALGLIGNLSEGEKSDSTEQKIGTKTQIQQSENMSASETEPSKVETTADTSKTKVQKTDSTKATKQKNETLTLKNNKEFAKISKLNDHIDPKIEEFFNQYKGRKIEFDGCIAYLEKHEDYQTRYNLTIYIGDWTGSDLTKGPVFHFRNVNTFDMGIKDLYLPGYMRVGRNVHVIGEMKEYDPDTSGFIVLDPISVTER